MTHDEILKKLHGIMKSTTRENVDWDSISEASRVDALGFDSLSILDLMYDIQQGFEIEFDPSELVHLKTVGDFVAFLETRTA